MSGYTVAWLLWLVSFVAIEGVALLDKDDGDTLTAHIVKWASLKQKSGGWMLRRGVLFGFLGWFVYHFVSRWG